MTVRNYVAILGAVIVGALVSGCWQGWQMDYGKPAGQFLAAEVVGKGGAYVGKKVTIKGTVLRVDTSVPDDAVVVLENGITCKFGKFAAMADQYKVGETIYVDGYLKRCKPEDVLMEPAMGRDPKAPFDAE